MLRYASVQYFVRPYRSQNARNQYKNYMNIILTLNCTCMPSFNYGCFVVSAWRKTMRFTFVILWYSLFVVNYLDSQECSSASDYLWPFCFKCTLLSDFVRVYTARHVYMHQTHIKSDTPAVVHQNENNFIIYWSRNQTNVLLTNAKVHNTCQNNARKLLINMFYTCAPVTASVQLNRVHLDVTELNWTELRVSCRTSVASRRHEHGFSRLFGNQQRNWIHFMTSLND